MDRRDELDLKVFSFHIRDNPSLTDKYINDLSAEYQGLWYKRYIEGKWVLAEGAVYDFFDEKIHVIPMATSPASYYILGIDYGTTNPCVFSLIGYNSGSYPNMWLEKEYYYDSRETLRQKSDYEYACDLIQFIDGYYIKQIYIDPSAASLKQELVRQGIYNVKDAENDVLPGIRFQGQLLTNGTYKICANCEHSIKEYSNYLWDAKASDKGIDKPIKKFDHCFVEGTTVITRNGKKPIELISSGDIVLTANGWDVVKATFASKKEVSTYVILGREITCTDSHKFYTVNGQKKACDLTHSDILFTELIGLRWIKSAYFRESNIDVMSELKMLMAESTLERLKRIRLREMDTSIEIFGNCPMKKYHKNTIFITKMGIPSTMTLAVSGVENLLKIYPFMQGILPLLERELKYGGLWEFVRMSVSHDGEELITLIMNVEYAEYVVQNLFTENIKKDSPDQGLVPRVPIGERRVYNIHVADNHEFFAENILVANCLDSQRYALFSHFFFNQGKSMTESDAEEIERMYIRKY